MPAEMNDQSHNGDNRTNPQTKQANTYGYPGLRGSGQKVINHQPTNRTNVMKRGR